MKALAVSMKRIFILIIQLFFVCSYSQSVQIADSLRKLIQQEKLTLEEKSRLLSLRAYHLQDIDSSLISAKQALAIAQKIDKPLLQAAAWEEIGHIERRLGNNSVSLQASLTALRIYESLGLREEQAASYGQLASNSISDEDFNTAIGYLKKAKKIYDISDKNGNQILTVLNLGEAFRLAGRLDSAEVYFQETLKRNRVIKHDIVQGYTLGNLGMVYAAQNKLVQAKNHLNGAIKVLRPISDPYSTSVYIAELGSIHKKESNWELAEDKLLEAHNMAITAGLKEQIRDFSKNLSDFYKEMENHQKALEYLELNKVYHDSLLNKESIQKIEQLKAGYEIDKRETEIGLLNTINANQKNTVIILVVGVLILLMLAYLLFRSNRTIKRTNNDLALREQEKALLLKELNHRVKNNLQMVSSLLNLQSRELSGHPAQEAILMGRNRVEALSLVHKKLYQEGLETRIFLKDYIEELVLDLFHGYGVKFKPSFDIIDVSLSVDTVVPVALIINEVVVNSLKYAYKGVANPNLEISVKKVKNELEINISDNGVGFSTQDENKENSFGIKLITSLIEQLDGNIKRLTDQGTHWKMKLKAA
ncbi:histidine kinase dimerization/phosphoacceptor domain -containing protein [Flagellimonas sp. S3867]|uniref:histidine kinase dimerization/phosphoacceptor domain -containing protein n=1 Tax=Flagellimonas sp. S3867 TaxID=2768063 RepID=UPI001CC24DCF|nr:histidine kinase dimerization/phosphoacceptor domain -containing protein [Flagellimonas sp. S3867]